MTVLPSKHKYESCNLEERGTISTSPTSPIVAITDCNRVSKMYQDCVAAHKVSRSYCEVVVMEYVQCSTSEK